MRVIPVRPGSGVHAECNLRIWDGWLFGFVDVLTRAVD